MHVYQKQENTLLHIVRRRMFETLASYVKRPKFHLNLNSKMRVEGEVTTVKPRTTLIEK